MTPTVSAGEEREGEVSGGRIVVVGVKFDSHSRELLTWALMKEAQPGDHVIALHVLNSNEIVDRDGKSSLALVKAFGTVLSVYEGFCNLKQVDLKLKVCSGSSVRKILVREARSYFANEVIVGTARKHRTIRSSAFVAKYCAKKLRNDCSVLAVDNGKTVFHKEASQVTDNCEKGIDVRQHRLLSVIQKSMLSKSFNVLCIAHDNENPPASGNLDSCGNSEPASVKSGSHYDGSAMKQNCSICSSNNSMLPENSRGQSRESSTSGDGDESNSTVIVALQKVEAASSSTSMPIKGMPELRFGWPLLRRAVLSDRQVSLDQGAMQLPRRKSLLCAYSKQSEWNREENQPSELDVESGVIALVGAETLSAPTSPSSSRSLPEELEGLYEKYSSTCRLFKYHELLQATSYFNPDNLIGKGGNSKVYRGRLPDEKEIAVKSLRPSVDVLKEFVLEIEIITALHHKNIISLYGFCFEDRNLLLVYDFLSRGSVEDNLHGNKKDPCSFGWSERYKVAVNVAESLEYLHNESAKPVIHRDVKSSNILLSEDFDPQLSDFGLAKWASTTSSHITSTDVSGTFGYLAPEYFMFGKVNNKIDVYAFGVVLLELLSGRKPINNDHPKGQESLVMWAKPILNGGKLVHLLDPCLDKNYDSDQMERMVLAAILCIRRAPRGRPQMSIVLKLLQGDLEVIKWARVQITSSEESDMLDDEAFPPSNLQSHINLALFDVHEDSLSMSSIDQTLSFEDYLRGRWTRSSSFD